jgi:hypothetical protein
MFDDILKFPVWASNIACWMTFPSNYPLSSGSFPKSHVCLPEGKHENNSRHMKATCKHHLCWHHLASHEEKTHLPLESQALAINQSVLHDSSLNVDWFKIRHNKSMASSLRAGSSWLFNIAMV